MRFFVPTVALALLTTSLHHSPESLALMSASVSAEQNLSVLRLDPALDHLIAPGTVPEVFAGGFTFTEGPMWRAGRLWFVDEEGDKIHAATADGHVSTLLDYQQGPYKQSATSLNHGKTGPNAMATAPDGSVIAMQQYARDVVRLTEDAAGAQPLSQAMLFDSYDGKHLNSPNDLVFAPDGSFYFTDPNYGLPQQQKDAAKQLPYQAVFHVKDGKLMPVIRDLPTPNGIALSPDARTLYVNNSGPQQRVIAYAVQADGSVRAGHDVITFTGHEGRGVPDGLKTDAEGNLWTTGPGGIRVITPQGKVLGQIRLPEVAANLAWGGEDGRTLYITAQTHVYRLAVLRPGSLPRFTR